MRKLKPGDKVWVTRWNGTDGHEQEVTSVGRRWGTIDGDIPVSFQFDLTTGESKAMARTIRRVFDDQAAADEFFSASRQLQARDDAWSAMFRAISGRWTCPEHLAEADIREIQAKIFPEKKP